MLPKIFLRPFTTLQFCTTGDNHASQASDKTFVRPRDCHASLLKFVLQPRDLFCWNDHDVQGAVKGHCLAYQEYQATGVVSNTHRVNHKTRLLILWVESLALVEILRARNNSQNPVISHMESLISPHPRPSRARDRKELSSHTQGMDEYGFGGPRSLRDEDILKLLTVFQFVFSLYLPIKAGFSTKISIATAPRA